MKNKLLIFIITCAICLNISAYADEHKTNNIETLEKYGIIQGDDNGELKLNNYITRSEVATVVCKLLCLDLTDEKSCFTDVTDDFWGKNYINVAYKYNIIHGYGNMCFKPNQNITYAETIKVLVSCLGYAPIAEKNGDYPSGYITIARDLGIIANTSYNPDELLMRKDVFNMIYNSLDIPIAIEENYGEKRILIMDGRYDDTPLTTLRMSFAEN